MLGDTDVDNPFSTDIQEYLLLKGVEAVAIHGSKSTSFLLLILRPHLTFLPGQEERQYAIKSFKSGAKDVMVASGVASKGLDFNDIQHVIIFSMPKEIEDYVHQIGRTGRSGKTGIATTFVNMNTAEQTLLDLKYLLMEAGQKYVHWIFSLQALCSYIYSGFRHSCKASKILGRHKAAHSRAARSAVVYNLSYLSAAILTNPFYIIGLGHGISNCPKREDAQRRQVASMRSAQDVGGY